MTKHATFPDRLARLGLVQAAAAGAQKASRRLRSALSVEETARTLAAGLRAQGAAICVDTPAWSECGRPGRLLLFVTPGCGPDAADGLQLPGKALVQEDAEGAVWITWQDPWENPGRAAA